MPTRDLDSRGLIDRSDIVDVQLQESHARRSVPHAPVLVRAEVSMDAPTYQLDRGRIYIRFAHQVDFCAEPVETAAADENPISADSTPDKPAPSGDHSVSDLEADAAIGEVFVAHVIELAYSGEPPGAEEIDSMIIRNTHFTVYPYVRAEIQRAAASVGLPPLVLDFLRRPLRETGPEPTAEP